MNFDFHFNGEGLIPVIVQQIPTAECHYPRVLMMAWMNRQSLEVSLNKGFMHYWSRSRKKLWMKGETSGHVQRIVRWFVDCDRDTLLFYVDQKGGACHTGFESCFFRELDFHGQELPIQERPIFEPTEVYPTRARPAAPSKHPSSTQD